MSSKRNTQSLEGLIGQVIHDRFRIENLLGRGNVGVVYRATDLRDQRLVAVKIVKYDLNEKGLQANFDRDAELVAKIKHPNAVPILEFGALTTGGGYFVMEYVEGRTLRDLIKEKGRFPYKEALQILKKICEPLSMAHKLGVWHLDLKPENVVLPKGAEDNLKVADFGLAKLKEGVEKSKANLTAAGEVMGTPSYMSPEQGLGAGVDERTDIYALGVMLYELISGKPPFEGNFFAVLQMHMSKAVPPLKQTVPDLPANVESLVSSLLDKTKDKRIQSIDEVISRIDQLEKGGGAPAPAVTTAPVASSSAAAAVSTPAPVAAAPIKPASEIKPASAPAAAVSSEQPAGNNMVIIVVAAIVIIIGLIAVGHWGLKLF